MKSNLIISVALVAVFLGIFVWQRNDFQRLREQIAGTGTSRVDSGTGTESGISGDELAAPSLSRALESSARKTEISETVTQLLNLPSDPDGGEDASTIFRKIRGILDFLKDQSSAELFLILDDLEARKPQDRRAREMSQILLIVLADVEPEKSLAFVNGHFSEDPSAAQHFKIAALSALAESDPDKAIASLKTQTWVDEDFRRMTEMKIFESLADRDLRKALSYFDRIEMPAEMKSAVIMQASQSPGRREDIWKLLGEELTLELRHDLSVGVLASIGLEAGLSGIDEALPRLEFARVEDRDRALLALVGWGLRKNPVETMLWIQREISAEGQSKAISESVKEWATRDFAAAGNWLREQEPSADRNAAIAAYSTSVAGLDPRVALEWSDEIFEKKLQADTHRKILEKWYQKEPRAAQEWVAEHGLDPKELLPGSGPEE